MIRRDDSPCDDAPRRHFGLMVRAAEPAFLPINVDEANHVAKGLLDSGNGVSIRALLSYEDSRRSIRLVVALPWPGRALDERRAVLDRLQAASEMSRFDQDKDGRQLTLRASSLCTQPDRPSDVVEQLLEDVQRILADDRLSAVLGR